MAKPATATARSSNVTPLARKRPGAQKTALDVVQKLIRRRATLRRQLAELEAALTPEQRQLLLAIEQVEKAESAKQAQAVPSEEAEPKVVTKSEPKTASAKK
jgi:hypothetical protein